MPSHRAAIPGRHPLAVILALVVLAPSLSDGRNSPAAQERDEVAVGSLTAVHPARAGGDAPNAPLRRAFGTPAPSIQAAPNRTQATLLRLPLSFEPAPESSKASTVSSSFVARGPGYTVSLSPAAAVVALAEGAHGRQAKQNPSAALSRGRPFVRPGSVPNSEGGGAASSRNEKQSAAGERSSPDILRLELVGANASAPAEGLDPLPGKSNYYIGSDAKSWRTNVPTFARVRYEGVYPGVDLVYYGNPQLLEFDFVVRPGADVNAIKFAVSNAAAKDQAALRIAANGALVIPTTHGEVRLRRPVIYQEGPGNGARKTGVRTPVEGRYVLTSAREVRFEVGDYDQRQALVIDPTLEYSSFLGGSGWDFGVSAGVSVDAAGNLYIASGTASANFPGTPGGFQGASPDCDLGGERICGDAFVTKINPSGTAVLYSTYLGGTGADGAYGLAVDSSGNAYVAGPTDSTDFATTPGAYQTEFGGDTPGCASAGTYPPCGDAYVAKLNAAGAVIYSTYLGGSADDYAEAVAVDSSGNAYVTGQTTSADYPTTPGAFQEISPAGSCGASLCGIMFVSKIDSTGSALAYSTYVGGPSGSVGAGIDVDTAGLAYATGSANWNDFPTTANAYQPAVDDSGPILVKLDSTGSSLLYSTYLDGNSWGLGLGVAVDASGNAYLGGLTNSSDFPVTAGAFQSNLTNWTGFHA